MALLIAEELLLTVRESGVMRTKRVERRIAEGGALLAELVLDGHLNLVGKRVEPTGLPGGPAHPELTAALSAVRAAERRAPMLVVRELGQVTTVRRLLDGLATAGLVTKERGPLPLAWQRWRYRLADPFPRQEVLRRVRASVVGGQPPDRRTAVLAALIHVADLRGQVFPDDDRGLVTASLRAIAEEDWLAEAVYDAIMFSLAGPGPHGPGAGGA